jgi:hypothetical protein
MDDIEEYLLRFNKTDNINIVSLGNTVFDLASFILQAGTNPNL